MLWLALSFPELALDVFTARLADPDKPVVVLTDGRVSFMNEAAEAADIAVGSSLATAHTIHADLAHFHRDPHAEEQRLHTLADALYRFSDHVSVQPPDCVLLEIGGSLRLFGSHQALQNEAVKLCSELGHSSLAHCATTPRAAIALARSQHSRPKHSQSKHSPLKQEGLADVPLSLAGMELAGVPPQVIERFENMGIYTLGPLLELPSTELGKRFGPALLLYLEQLTGRVSDPRLAITPAPVFARETHLLQPINDKEVLFDSPHSPMQTLARELQHWLVAHQLGCERLEWRFGPAVSSSPKTASVCVPVRFARGKQDQGELLRISQLKLEHVALPEEVLTVGLSAQRLTPWRDASRNLFTITPATNTDQPHSSQPLNDRAAELVNELSARLGESACRGVQNIVQHTPESAWSEIAAHELLHVTRRKPENSEPITSKRPLWLFDQPRPVERHDLTLMHGPERIQSQWWSRTTSRDYYIAQHCNGAECWAFVDDHARWYLHGYFA
jgi:protein ImuB